ncbi:MAG: hypothetical protein WD358_00915 [Nitriliruptoraceae bacterium]
MRRLRSAAALAACAMLFGACAPAEAIDLPADQPVAGAPDDGNAGDPAPAIEYAVDLEREQARGLLGMHEEDLPDGVRISRRGDDDFALTEDYVIGRRTVQLDDDGSGFRVMSVTIELPDGPETFELQGG